MTRLLKLPVQLQPTKADAILELSKEHWLT
jgi:hypothetical protein